MDLSVIILNYRTPDLLRRCLKSIESFEWKKKIEVIVVDNNSGDDSVGMVRKEFPKFKLIESPENGGFAKGNNLGLKVMKSNLALLLNSDTQVKDGSLDSLVEFMKGPEFGIGSCKLVYPDGSFQPNAGELPTILPVFDWISGLDDVLPLFKQSLPSFHRQFKNYYRGNKKVGWVSGTAMLIKKETIKKIGLLDENIFMYGEDVEYCLRAAKKGIKVGWTDEATIVHVGGGSSKNPSLRQWVGEMKGLIYIYKKYYGILAQITLRALVYVFTFARMIAFTLVGRREASKTYAKVLLSI